MLKSVNWPNYRSYKSGTDFEPIIFYLDALTNSSQIDLLLGYFSSSAISVLSLGFARFISNGGKLRLIINHLLSKEDKSLLINATKNETFSLPIDITNVNGLNQILDDYGKHFFDCLTWLFANRIFDIKVIKPLNKKGISHFKSGIVTDRNNAVGFKASCNFTAFGLLDNLEELDIYLSWEDERSKYWIERQGQYFEDIFQNYVNFVEYIPVGDIQVALKNEFGNKDIDELLINETELLKKKKILTKNERIIHHLNKLQMKIEDNINMPRFPFSGGPRDYQSEAYNRWVANNKQGIFAMATGTGKTITAINCILNEAKLNDGIYHALILVPTVTLVNQWKKELSCFTFDILFCVSSQNSWKVEVTTYLWRLKYKPSSFVIISTYDTFIKDTFRELIPLLPKDTIFIADEAHHLGRQTVQQQMTDFPLSKRIGLSATPKRYYDPAGTAMMEEFFSDYDPFTFSFSMERAISEKILCEYEYYPHIVALNNEEVEEYNKISKQLSKNLYAANDIDENDNTIKMLLIKRKRVIHKASNKLSMTVNILTQIWENKRSLQYTLVYVPEGIVQEIPEGQNEESLDSIRLIDIYAKKIAEIDENITVNQIYSGAENRDEILTQFSKGKIHVLTSMKCLDEGIDIPRTETAIFCSSTGNPRQFIQRRGRVLRRHPDKHKAIIHDLVVVPDISSLDRNYGNFEVERKLVKKELERVMYFASLSKNFYYSINIFNSICAYFDLNLFTIYEELRS